MVYDEFPVVFREIHEVQSAAWQAFTERRKDVKKTLHPKNLMNLFKYYRG